MADKIPSGKDKKGQDNARKEASEPSNVGNDQYTGWNRGQNFQPRNAGDVEDSIDRESARVARETNARAAAAEQPGPHQETEWEARVERGEEWEEEDENRGTSADTLQP